MLKFSCNKCKIDIDHLPDNWIEITVDGVKWHFCTRHYKIEDGGIIINLDSKMNNRRL